MTISSKKIADLLESGSANDPNGVFVSPTPDIEKVRSSGEAAVNLRLSRWFLRT